MSAPCLSDLAPIGSLVDFPPVSQSQTIVALLSWACYRDG